MSNDELVKKYRVLSKKADAALDNARLEMKRARAVFQMKDSNAIDFLSYQDAKSEYLNAKCKAQIYSEILRDILDN